MSDLRLRRNEATQRIMKALARLVATEPLPVRLDDGSTPVVVAVPEEPVQDMLARLHRAGGAANVVVDYVDSFYVASFFSSALPAAAVGDPADVHNNSNVGMLIDWLLAQPHGAGAFRMNGARLSDSAPESPQVREHEYQF